MLDISFSRRVVLGCMVASGIAFGTTVPSLAQSDPLPSWNDGAAKTSILEFVAKVTKEGGPDFVAPGARIATFDNDGTLWVEQPLYIQLVFALEEIKRLAPNHPEWANVEPFKSV